MRSAAENSAKCQRMLYCYLYRIFCSGSGVSSSSSSSSPPLPIFIFVVIFFFLFCFVSINHRSAGTQSLNLADTTLPAAPPRMPTAPVKNFEACAAHGPSDVHTLLRLLLSLRSRLDAVQHGHFCRSDVCRLLTETRVCW